MRRLVERSVLVPPAATPLVPVVRPLWVVLCAVVLSAGTSTAADFRVETTITRDGDKGPPIRNTTLFHGHLVYDFLENPAETTIFDPRRGRIVLLDPQRKLRAEVNTENLLKFCDQLKIWAAKHEDRLLKFCAAPAFKEISRPDGDEIRYESAVMTYSLVLDAAHRPDEAAQYRGFCDWYARLNARLHPASLPPFARLVINKRIGSAQRLPREVRLTIPPSRRFDGQKLVLTSRHKVEWRLRKSDLADIQAAGRHLVTFRRVTLAEYRRTNGVVKR